MNRLADIHERDTTDKATDILAGIKKAVGKVPNAHLTVGGHSPTALQQALVHNAVLHKGSLSAQQLEVINLSVSEATGCDYCLAAHTLMAEKAGSNSEQIRTLRHGEYTGETQLDALVKFAQTLMITTGTLPKADVTMLRNAGLSDRQVIEIISAVSTILFTSMVSRVNGTVVGFPEAD